MPETKEAEATKPYARCKACGIDLLTKDDQSAHMSETLESARQANPDATYVSGHSTVVVNPTPEEVEARRIRNLIDFEVDDAIRRCCEDLDDQIRRGWVTEDQVTDGLRHYPDFSDAWEEWVADNA